VLIRKLTVRSEQFMENLDCCHSKVCLPQSSPLKAYAWATSDYKQRWTAFSSQFHQPLPLNVILISNAKNWHAYVEQDQKFTCRIVRGQKCLQIFVFIKLLDDMSKYIQEYAGKETNYAQKYVFTLRPTIQSIYQNFLRA